MGNAGGWLGYPLPAGFPAACQRSCVQIEGEQATGCAQGARQLRAGVCGRGWLSVAKRGVPAALAAAAVMHIYASCSQPDVTDGVPFAAAPVQGGTRAGKCQGRRSPRYLGRAAGPLLVMRSLALAAAALTTLLAACQLHAGHRVCPLVHVSHQLTHAMHAPGRAAPRRSQHGCMRPDGKERSRVAHATGTRRAQRKGTREHTLKEEAPAKGVAGATLRRSCSPPWLYRKGRAGGRHVVQSSHMLASQLAGAGATSPKRTPLSTLQGWGGAGIPLVVAATRLPPQLTAADNIGGYWPGSRWSDPNNCSFTLPSSTTNCTPIRPRKSCGANAFGRPSASSRAHGMLMGARWQYVCRLGF